MNSIDLEGSTNTTYSNSSIVYIASSTGGVLNNMREQSNKQHHFIELFKCNSMTVTGGSAVQIRRILVDDSIGTTFGGMYCYPLISTDTGADSQTWDVVYLAQNSSNFMILPFRKVQGNLINDTSTAKNYVSMYVDDTNYPLVKNQIRVVNGTAGSLQDTSTELAVFQANNATSDIARILIVGGNATGYSIVDFGDNDDNDVGSIQYDHSTNSFNFRTNATSNRMVIDSKGDINMRGNTTINSTDVCLKVLNFTGGTLPDISGELAVFQQNNDTNDKARITLIGGHGADGYSIVDFGDKDDADVGSIQYDHNNNRFTFRTNGTSNRVVMDNSGNLNVSNAITVGTNASVIRMYNATSVMYNCSLNATNVLVCTP
jgi:hypothetical protein